MHGMFYYVYISEYVSNSKKWSKEKNTWLQRKHATMVNNKVGALTRDFVRTRGLVLLALAMIGSLYVERSPLSSMYFTRVPKGRGIVNARGLTCEGTSDQELLVCLVDSIRTIVSRTNTTYSGNVVDTYTASQVSWDTIGVQELEWLEKMAAGTAKVSPSEPTMSPCHPDCGTHGNCNVELGLCECPFGYEGDACEVDVLSHCRLKPGAQADCGTLSLKSCQCMRQCLQFSKRRHHEIDFQQSNIKCFNRTNVDQYHNPPNIDDPDVSYHVMSQENGELVLELAPEAALREGDHMTLNMKSCPGQCNGQGVCIQLTDNPNATCLCYRGFSGNACETQHEHLCYGNCLGRGTCVNGFCHCESGYFGIGCHREAALHSPRSNNMPSATQLKIYMYNLPSHVAHVQTHVAGFQKHHSIYISYDRFLHQLLGSPYLTQDPKEAHVFYIPALTYESSSNVGDPTPHLNKVIDYVKHTYPYWNASGGLDHIIWTSGDRGGCLISNDEALAPIQLTHFGFVHSLEESHPCFNVSKDIVMPPYVIDGMEKALDTYQSLDNPGVVDSWKKSKLLFFSGGTRDDDPSYSGSSRQILLNESLQWNSSVFDINRGLVDNYFDRMKDSIFCFAPYGNGWGIRLSEAILHGCIPVIIQDGVVQPFQDIIPYQEFSITLSNDDIKNLPQILSMITPEEIQHLRKGLANIWPAFVYETHPQSRMSPFHLTMASLRRRHVRLKSKTLQ